MKIVKTSEELIQAMKDKVPFMIEAKTTLFMWDPNNIEDKTDWSKVEVKLVNPKSK